MRDFFRISIILILTLAVAGCKTKSKSPIADCTVSTSENPVTIYSDLETKECTNCELPVFTKLTVIEQSGDLLKVKFTDGSSKKTGWISLKQVTMNKEIFDRTVKLLLDGDENAKILFQHSFYRFNNEDAVDSLTQVLDYLHLGDRLQKDDWEDEEALHNFVSLILPKFEEISDLNPDTTNPLHLLIPYANEYVLRSFCNLISNDSDGRSCLMLAVKAQNLEAVEYFYKESKACGFSDLEHKDNEGRSIVDYIDSCPNKEIKERLALCRYDASKIIGQCVEYLCNTQDDREREAEALTDRSKDSDTILLTQQELRSGDTPIVVRQAEMFLPDGTKTLLNPYDTIEIVELLANESRSFNTLFEYDAYNPDSTEKYYTRYNYYLVRFKDKIGILGGSALAHKEIPMGSHFGSSAKLDGVKLYVDYKYIKSLYDNSYTYYADLYEYDLKTEQLRKLETGVVKNEMEFEVSPIYLGNQEFMRNFMLVESFKFKLYEGNYYFCAFSFNPFSWAEDRTLYHFYAIRNDGIAFLLGTFGNSEYVHHYVEVNSSFYASLDKDAAVPELTMYEYGYKYRHKESGEKADPFTVKENFKLDADLMQFYETGVESEDCLPEF